MPRTADALGMPHRSGDDRNQRVGGCQSDLALGLRRVDPLGVEGRPGIMKKSPFIL